MQNTANGQTQAPTLLWPDGAPGAVGTALIDQPALTIHLPDAGSATGTGIVVAPGGGYSILAADHEGLQVAHWLNRQGIAAFVLRYRVLPNYDAAVSLLDAQRAIRYVRHHAATFGISKTRIGMLGFSAGGHLASAAGTSFARVDGQDAKRQDAQSKADAIDRESSRPDFIALVYPAIDGRLFDSALLATVGITSDAAARMFPPTHLGVTADTSPTFIMQTHEDPAVTPRHVLRFYEALLDAHVPAEMHVFGFGAHGLGLAPGDDDLAQWTTLFMRWLKRSGFLGDARRVAVHGRVTVDGKPMRMGWVTFLIDDPTAPLVCVYADGNEEGKFQIDVAHGAVPGKYRVAVWRLGSIWPLDNRGTYSQAGAEHYTRLKPTDADGIFVTLGGDAADAEIMLNIVTR